MSELSENAPRPEVSGYTIEDYRTTAWHVLTEGYIYDRYLVDLADRLSDFLTPDRINEASVHGIDMTPIQIMRSQAIDKATIETEELVDELNRGVDKFGGVEVALGDANKGGIVLYTVDSFKLGDELGSIRPVVDGQELSPDDYDVLWRPDDYKG